MREGQEKTRQLLGLAAGFPARLIPSLAHNSTLERARSAIGALIGILLTGLASRAVLGNDVSLPLLIAPMGASAVLLFAAPTSPLAQPWSILGGNMVSALIGVTCATMIPDPIIAGSLAVALAITAMLLLGCLHPPSGAVALTAVLGGPAIKAAGFWFVLSPVGLNSVLLLAVALIFNNFTGRRYPHIVAAKPHVANETSGATASALSGITVSDAQDVLEHYGEVVAISPDELAKLIHRAQVRAFSRRTGETTCGHIMVRDVKTVTPATTLRAAWKLLLTGKLKALPVVDAENQLVGMISQDEFIQAEVLNDAGRLRSQFHHKLRRAVGMQHKQRHHVSDIMRTRVQSALEETMIAKLVSPMADRGLHYMPVVDPANRIVGMVTQSDLIAALFQRELDMPPAPGELEGVTIIH